MAKELSQSVEDYLKAIYKLDESGRRVSKSEVATVLGVSAASVTNMIKKMAEMGLVKHESYKDVALTETGHRAALEVVRHHRLLETYLREVMGYSWHQMHEEAEQLEHHISEVFEKKIDEMLGYPTHDPHGHPIPSLEGDIEFPDTKKLSDVVPGHALTVHHVEDGDPDVLAYLEQIGLLPQAEVMVVEKAPFDGPVTINIDNRREVIGNKVAGHIFVIDDGD
ncbi:MAG: metal-dependent transcriptional regulator [Candidatus Latescibacterota bacterium]|jgi:DtxR family Mn-dependent transcriptional regulator